MQNPKRKIVLSISRIWKRKKQLSFLNPVCFIGTLAQQCKGRCLFKLANKIQADPFGVWYTAIMQVINPLIFKCVHCQTWENKREEDESKVTNYEGVSPDLSDRPFFPFRLILLKLRGAICCMWCKLNTTPANSAEDSAGSKHLRVARLNQPTSIEMYIWLDIAFPLT